MAVLAPRPPPSTGWQKFQFLPKKRSWEPLTAPPPPPSTTPCSVTPPQPPWGLEGGGHAPPPPGSCRSPGSDPGLEGAGGHGGVMVRDRAAAAAAGGTGAGRRGPWGVGCLPGPPSLQGAELGVEGEGAGTAPGAAGRGAGAARPAGSRGTRGGALEEGDPRGGPRHPSPRPPRQDVRHRLDVVGRINSCGEKRGVSRTPPGPPSCSCAVGTGPANGQDGAAPWQGRAPRLVDVSHGRDVNRSRGSQDTLCGQGGRDLPHGWDVARYVPCGCWDTHRSQGKWDVAKMARMCPVAGPSPRPSPAVPRAVARWAHPAGPLPVTCRCNRRRAELGSPPRRRYPAAGALRRRRGAQPGRAGLEPPEMGGRRDGGTTQRDSRDRGRQERTEEGRSGDTEMGGGGDRERDGGDREAVERTATLGRCQGGEDGAAWQKVSGEQKGRRQRQSPPSPPRPQRSPISW